MAFSNITYDHIYGDFWYGTYDKNWKVIINRTTGFINATHMCQMDGKSFCDWLQNESTKELIHWVKQHPPSNHLESPPVCLDVNRVISFNQLLTPDIADLIVGEKGNEETGGLYLHYKLIVQVAWWISPTYALKVSDIVWDYRIKEQNDQVKIKNEQLRNKKIERVEKRDQYMQIQANLDTKKQSLEKMELALTWKHIESKCQQNALKEATTDLAQVRLELKNTQLDLKKVRKTLSHKHLESSYTEFTLYALSLDIGINRNELAQNDVDLKNQFIEFALKTEELRTLESHMAKLKPECTTLQKTTQNQYQLLIIHKEESQQTKYPYYVIKQQVACIKKAHDFLTTMYPFHRDIYFLDHWPASINVFHTLRKNNAFTCKYNSFNTTLSEEELKQFIDNLVQ